MHQTLAQQPGIKKNKQKKQPAAIPHLFYLADHSLHSQKLYQAEASTHAYTHQLCFSSHTKEAAQLSAAIQAVPSSGYTLLQYTGKQIIVLKYLDLYAV